MKGIQIVRQRIFNMKRATLLNIAYACLLMFTVSIAHAQEHTLSYFLENAQKNSPLLKDLNNQQASGRIDKQILKAGIGPQVHGISLNSYAPVIGGYGYDEVITNKGNFAALLAVNKPIVSKANWQNQYNQIELTNQSVQNSRAISEQDLSKLITDDYITAFGSWQQYQFTNDICQLLQAEDSLLLRLTQQAVYRQTDYLTFLVTFKQQKLALQQAKAQYENDLAGLNRDCGIVDSDFILLQEPALPNPLLPEADSTVFYRKFVLDSLILKNDAEHIDFGYKPVVNLFADAGYNSSLSYLPYKNFGVSFGISLIVPIYDGHQRALQHNKIALAEQTRQSYATHFKTQYVQQVVQLQQQLRAAEEIVQSANEQLRYSKALMDANRKLLVQGDVRISDYVIAINNYLSAKNVITINAQKILFITNQLNYWKR